MSIDYGEIGPEPPGRRKAREEEERRAREAEKTAMSPPTPGLPPLPKEVREKQQFEYEMMDYPLYFDSGKEREEYKNTIYTSEFDKEKLDAIPILSKEDVAQADKILREAMDRGKENVVSEAQYQYLKEEINRGIPNEKERKKARLALVEYLGIKEEKEREAEKLLQYAAKVFDKGKKIGEYFSLSPYQEKYLRELILSKSKTEKNKAKLLEVLEEMTIRMDGEKIESEEKTAEEVEELSDKDLIPYEELEVTRRRALDEIAHADTVRATIEEEPSTGRVDTGEPVKKQIELETEQLLGELDKSRTEEKLSEEVFKTRQEAISLLEEARLSRLENTEKTFQKIEISPAQLAYLRQRIFALSKSPEEGFQRTKDLEELFYVSKVPPVKLEPEEEMVPEKIVKLTEAMRKKGPESPAIAIEPPSEKPAPEELLPPSELKPVATPPSKETIPPPKKPAEKKPESTPPTKKKEVTPAPTKPRKTEGPSETVIVDKTYRREAERAEREEAKRWKKLIERIKKEEEEKKPEPETDRYEHFKALARARRKREEEKMEKAARPATSRSEIEIEKEETVKKVSWLRRLFGGRRKRKKEIAEQELEITEQKETTEQETQAPPKAKKRGFWSRFFGIFSRKK